MKEAKHKRTDIVGLLLGDVPIELMHTQETRMAAQGREMGREVGISLG